MGLIRSVLLSPVKGPLTGMLWVARQIQKSAQEELQDPATLRQRLHTLEQDLLAGRISEEAYEEAESQILMALKGEP